MVSHLHTKVNTGMTRQEKEDIIYSELMQTDRLFVRNSREMDLVFDFGRDTAQKFVSQIDKAEMVIGRRLNATEIEEKYQKTLEGLKNGNSN